MRLSAIRPLPALVLVLALAAATFADDSPKHAERGVQAYREGKFDLARLFFTKALQDAVLKGREEWVAKATLNLADLELEAMEEEEAGRLLESVKTRKPELMSLVLWKRSQLAFLRRRHGEALSLVDSALALSAGDRGMETSLRLDRLRYLIQSREPSAWEGEYGRYMDGLGSAARDRALALEAAAEMARQRFGRADTLWREAMARYRDQGRLAKVAACFNQSAICLFSRGLRAEALDMNARAVAIYAELGLAVPGLRAQALRLILADDEGELAKLRREMDLVGQRLGGFDLQGILDEYTHSMRGAPALPPGP
jgi:hypothetical protein